MYTQCPECRTIFEISEEALQVSLGIVHCGHCSARFDALRTLSDNLPADTGATLPEHDPATLAPTLTTVVSPEAMPAAATPATGAARAQPVEAWFDALAGDRARALIADAAGIPREAIQGDLGWQVTEPPVPSAFDEGDGIPPATSTTDAETAAEPAPSPVDLPVAASEPFTEAWGLDQAGGHFAVASPRDEDAWLDAVEPPAEYADAAVSPAGDEAVASTADGSPEDGYGIDPAMPSDTGDAEAASHAQAEPLDEPPAGAAHIADTAAPVYVPPRRRRIHRSDWLWAAGCLVLALALAVQATWASRTALVRDPATQALALRVCARLDCRLPAIRDIAKLELLSRDVRPDPTAAGALAITATFRNNAPYRQPWPIVVVELTDLDNNIVAMRRFRPADYMPDAARRAAGIAAGATAAVAFEVADPGKRAVSFRFGFD